LREGNKKIPKVKKNMFFTIFLLLMALILFFIYMDFIQGIHVFGILAAVLFITCSMVISNQGLSVNTRPIITDTNVTMSDGNYALYTTQINYVEEPIHGFKPDNTVNDLGVWFIIVVFPYIGLALLIRTVWIIVNP
jgi:hypothetical protein